MALAYTNGVPATIVSGDTLKFQLCLTGYPASAGWVCHVYIVGGQRLDLTGTASGDDFLFSATATETKILTAGRAAYHVQVSLAGEVKTIQSGWSKVKNSLSTLDSISAPTDPAEMVRTIDAAILGALQTGFASFSIGGQSATNYSLAELRIMRDHYSSLARQKKALERAKATGSYGKGIQVRVL